MACHPHRGAVWSAVRRTRPYRFTNAIHFRSRLMLDRSIHGTATVIALSLAAAPVSRGAQQAGDPALRALHWRLVGPYRGGRTVAIAVAPSDPNVLYVGSGEADWREDLTYGDGMWRSTDGGQRWQHLGLEDARHIAAVRVDPKDPELVYVAAMGHAFGPNATRGVFRSQDGGKTWKKLLFVDDSTGAIDLAIDPANPRILYAALWKAQRFPWGFAAGGGKSGLWKTSDGG